MVNCSPPSSSIHGILLARTLEWVAVPFSRVSFQPRLNLGLPYCRQIRYHLSHQGSPSTLADFKWDIPEQAAGTTGTKLVLTSWCEPALTYPWKGDRDTPPPSQWEEGQTISSHLVLASTFHPLAIDNLYSCDMQEPVLPLQTWGETQSTKPGWSVDEASQVSLLGPVLVAWNTYKLRTQFSASNMPNILYTLHTIVKPD